MARTLIERQVVLGMCAGMRAYQIAEAIERPAEAVARVMRRLLIRSGMQDRVEFALQQNAAVRELRYAQPGLVVYAGRRGAGGRIAA